MLKMALASVDALVLFVLFGVLQVAAWLLDVPAHEIAAWFAFGGVVTLLLRVRIVPLTTSAGRKHEQDGQVGQSGPILVPDTEEPTARCSGGESGKRGSTLYH